MFKPAQGLEPKYWSGHADFVEALNRASYHFADDTAREWSKGRECLGTAANIAFTNGWRFWQIQRVWEATSPLASFDLLIDQWVFAAYSHGKENL